MASPADRQASLRRELIALREKAVRFLSGRSMNEETTKASLIMPLLAVLGWDTADPAEVMYEYKRTSKDNPVDFCLCIQRNPVLFVEAKSLGENLADRRWTTQIISYAAQAGVGWIVLTNGVDYHVYNTAAVVPLEGKLFRKLSLVETSMDDLVRDMSLLAKEDFAGKRIDRAWDAHHVDSQVDVILRQLFAGDDALAKLICRVSDGKLSPESVRDSLLRADVRISFPPAPLDTPVQEEGAAGDPATTGRSEVTLADLIKAGLLRPPVELVCSYMGNEIRATVTATGEIDLNGNRYTSPSTAAGMARVPHFEGDLKGRPYPQTNGWTFWRIKDPDGQLVELDVLRRRLLSK
jgi:hypothetical protein